MTTTDARKRLEEKQGVRDKDSYVAFTTDYDPNYMREGGLTLIRKEGQEEPVQDFDEAVQIAEGLVREGRSAGTVEVVELAVVRRAVVRRAVEVEIR